MQARNPAVGGAKAILASLKTTAETAGSGNGSPWRPGLNTVWLPLRNATAAEVVLSLEFADKWILMSEVTFVTSPAAPTEIAAASADR